MEAIDSISNQDIYSIFKHAKDYKTGDIRNNLFQNKIFGLLFFEPSTRTRMSFETAIHRLGGKVITYHSQYSSEKKGEDFEDTIKTMETYVDLFIIRHPNKDILSKINQCTSLPVINAGNGDGEHPTQALLDVFTILEYFPNFPKKIAFTGDIKYSRTIHSLVKLLVKLNKNIMFYFICNPLLQPTKDLLTILPPNSYSISPTLDENIIQNMDVLYCTRLQKERYQDECVSNIYITPEVLKNSKSSLIIMHPLPRNDELCRKLDNDPRSKYFEQVKNGIYVRMALLRNILE